MNNLKLFVLMAGLTALFVALGGYVGGQGGMLFALLGAGVLNFAMYYGSASLVLRMYGARRTAGAARDATSLAPRRG
ncbi:MAG: hypothetical protein ACREMM_10690 [Gemmatimonadales bacterium]